MSLTSALEVLDIIADDLLVFGEGNDFAETEIDHD